MKLLRSVPRRRRARPGAARRVRAHRARPRRVGRVRDDGGGHRWRRSRPATRRRTPYFARYLDAPDGPWRDWLLFEVAGVFVGGFLSAALAGRLRRGVERGPACTVSVAAGDRVRRRRGDGPRRRARARLHERPGAHRRRAAQRRQLGVHAARVRRGVRRRAADRKDRGDERTADRGSRIGIAFGFALERAGLGSARKLTGQFYLTDFTVFKVMFSAIVTAMLGAFWLGRLGVLDCRVPLRARDVPAAAARRRAALRRRVRARRTLSGHVVRRGGDRPRRRRGGGRGTVRRRPLTGLCLRVAAARSTRAARAARGRCRNCCTCRTASWCCSSS